MTNKTSMKRASKRQPTASEAHKPGKWKPGQVEPDYDDGNPERIDWINSQWVKLAGYKWARTPGTDQRGVIMLTHGMDGHVRWNYLRHTTEHPETGELTWHDLRFDGSLIQMFNTRGFDVFGLDTISYGASDGHYDNMRSYFHKYEDLVADIIGFTKAHVAPACERGRPLSIIGISFGGCLATHALQRQPQLFSGGGVLIAPMLSVEQLKEVPINKLLLPAASFLSSAFPRMPLSGYTPNLLYPLEEEAFLNERMCYAGRLRARVGVECMRACDDVQANMSALVSSVLVIHDRDDTQVDMRGAIYLGENC
jgi:alpha-beta hydrolase superfamily lysophospholipase